MLRTTTVPKYLDSAGRPVSVASKPLAIGGEGAIYDVNGEPTSVAKIYKAPQPKDRSEKLQAMAGLVTPDLLKVAAWPTSTLHLTSSGPVVGILMPKISGFKEIHHLYSVAQRKKDYPDADWRFLTHAALNFAIAFETIHRHGHVVGDVNQKNVLVSDQAIVKFVDCDSFQVCAANGRLFRCGVGVPEYTPPELQGKSFRSFDRDFNHDRFGLAVLIFNLLMMGRHPFSGVYLDAGDMPLERAIQEGRFAYSRSPKTARMKPPPNTLPMTILDAALVALFERAFSPYSRSGPPNRPTAKEWNEALGKFVREL
jgi:DNA-binding helix-hairpin-helix protein with protein kinase domain